MKRIPVLSAACVLLAMSPVLASAQVVSFNPASSETLSCVGTYTVDVEVDSVITDLRAYTLHITYNGDRIAPISASAGALVSGAACSNIFFDSVADGGGSPVDTLKVDVGLLGCSVNGPGSILSVEFQRLATGANVIGTEINIDSGPTSLRDSGNNEIVISIGPASVMWTLCNTKPVAVDDGGTGFTTDEDVPFTTGNVLDNDFDPDAPDAVSFNGFDASGAAGGVSSNGDGTFDYTPVPETSGTDSFIYFITDGDLADTATVTITIVAVNDPPTALDDNATTPEDSTVTIDVLADNGNGADFDIDDTINPASTTLVPASGPTHGSVLNNGDGTFDYTPATNYYGLDSFRYTVDDFAGDTSTEATVTVTVLPMNDPPTAVDDSVSTPEDTSILIYVALDNGNGPDTDPDDGIHPGSVTIVSDATDGNTSVSGSTARVTYVPDPDFFGTDSFTYFVRDFAGDSSNVATVEITVIPANDAPDVTNPGNQTSQELDVVSLPVNADDVDLDPMQYLATGLPPTLDIGLNTGLITGQIDCGASAGSPYAVTVFVTDGIDTTEVAFQWTVNPAAPASVSAPAAAQKTTLNDSDGTTEITVSWSRDLVPNESVEVYRKGFGDYPEYDDGAGTAPTQPSSVADALANGWTLAGSVADTFLVDEPATRDFWYYVMFVVSPCSESGPSAMASGALNYHLGDFTDGTALPNPGDNVLNFNDIGLFGANYGTPVTLANNVLDIGPTTGGFVDSRPTTDNVIGFEDLVLFSINFGAVSKPGVGGLSAAARNAVTLTVPDLPEAGERLRVTLDLESSGAILAVSIPLLWNADVVEPAGYAAGDLLDGQAGYPLLLSPSPGTVDAATAGSAIVGRGRLASVEFVVKGPGDPGIGLGTIRARDSGNREVTVTAEEVRRQPVPIVTRLLPGAPNPFRAGTVVAFDLAGDGRVRLDVFSVDGRRVKTLADAHFAAGSYRIPWDGRDDGGRGVASGIYLVRFRTQTVSASGRIVRLR
jgi:hypothetical protein